MAQLPPVDNDIKFVDVLGRTWSIPYIYDGSGDVYICPLKTIVDFEALFVNLATDISEKIPRGHHAYVLGNLYYILDHCGNIIEESQCIWRTFEVSKVWSP
jgi:hypothetical protein